METQRISKLLNLTTAQRTCLKRGQLLTVPDVLLLSVQDLARKCRIVYREAQLIVDTVCEELAAGASRPRLLSDSEIRRDQIFTTGDASLDKALGGGIRTGKVWEIVGESAAGKTQLCMQLSLSVQLPSSLGGASGAACILSTSWTLPTNRLLEMSQAHPAFSPTICGLADVHTVKTPTIPALLHVLSNLLPNLIEDLAVRPDARPVRLLIIDALTELFHSHTKVSTKTLVERSKNLAEISTLLHRLADKYNIAVIVVNEVVDVIDRPPVHALAHEVLYQEQARLFGRADSVPGENLKEAALGLVWANQVNARIMLSRTKRMRYLEQEEIPVKRRRLNDGNPQPRDSDKPTLVRRLTVIFNSVAPPASLDYIVTSSGITTLLEQHTAASIDIPTTEPEPRPLGSQSSGSRGVEGVSLLDIPVAGTRETQEAETVNDPEVTAEDGPQVDADEWEAYWRDTDLDCDIFSQVDLDSLDSVRSGSS